MLKVVICLASTISAQYTEFDLDEYNKILSVLPAASSKLPLVPALKNTQHENPKLLKNSKFDESPTIE